MQPLISWSDVCAPSHCTCCYGFCLCQKKAASSSEECVLFFICIKKFMLSLSDRFSSVIHKTLQFVLWWVCFVLFCLVFDLSFKVSFCFLTYSFSSMRSFSLKPDQLQCKDVGCPGHTRPFGPSLSALILSVSYETCCITMDFLRYGLRERLASWGFSSMTWHIM